MSMFIPLFMCFFVSNLIAGDCTEPEKDFYDLKDFAMHYHQQYIENRNYFNQIAEDQKLSPEYYKQVEDLIDDILVDKIEKYINNTAQKCDDESLLGLWFDQVREIESYDTFRHKNKFIEVWNQVLRDRLDMRIYGNRLDGYLERLEINIFESLRKEVKFILIEWELEKQIKSPESYDDHENQEHKGGFELVFNKPISARGSHMKYLYRDISSGLLFCVVKVVAHGSQRSMPKEIIKGRLNKSLEANFHRKCSYNLSEPITPKKIDTVKSRKEDSPVNLTCLMGDLYARLHSYILDADFNFDQIDLKKIKKDKDLMVVRGEAYYGKLSNICKIIIDSKYEDYYFKNKHNYWLMSNKNKGRFLYFCIVIDRQENIFIESALQKDRQEKLKNQDKPLTNSTYPLASTAEIKDPEKSKQKELERKQAAELKKQEKQKQKIADKHNKPADNIKRLMKVLNSIPKKAINETLIFLKNFLSDPNLKININFKNYNGDTVILSAVCLNNLEIVKTIVERFKDEIDLDVINIHGRNPLFTAAELGNDEIFQYLLDHGANLYAQDSIGGTALSVAVEYNHDDIVKLIIENGRKNPEKFQKYLNVQFNKSVPENAGWSSLMIATFRGNANIVRILMNAGADTELANDLQETALIIAVKNGNKIPIKVLLERANPNAMDKDQQTSLMHALILWNDQPILYYSIVEVLLKKGANPNLTGKDHVLPLVQILDGLILDKDKRITIDTFELLLNYGADPNIIYQGEPILMYILSSYYSSKAVSVYQMVLSFKLLSPYISNRSRLKAVKDMINHKHAIYKKFVNMVIEANNGRFDNTMARLNFIAYDCLHAIHCVVELLLKKGADPNATSKNLDTALHYMAKAGNIDMVKLLLEYKAQASNMNNRGQKPRDWVIEAEELAEGFLQSYNEEAMTKWRDDSVDQDNLSDNLFSNRQIYSGYVKIYLQIKKLLENSSI